MRVAVYVRVSTRGQELDNQKHKLLDYCERSSWKVAGVYCDVVSGRDLSRPAFDRLFSDAHKRLFDMVLFWALDRFARSGMTFTVLKLNELNSLGIRYHSYREDLINTDNELVRNIVIAVMSSLAKIESEKISERTRLAFTKDESGRTVARVSGKRVGRASLPVETVRWVEELLRDGGLSYRCISRMVSYKVKFGGVRHVSIGQIAKIKKQMNGDKI